ncbi:MAG: tRNA uridine(34) 5-carboxymethylaminomethyl modification radical SAM/GNAT enzyme Elp3 [Candidatus Diapherotrites archaeon]|nr:tRNA uridine(34) 5-carboxymethylaminomethyl modification radical SAM/GNAT enzyme Elp3 [Candidatus Diapherotrites archaeon]
MSPNDNPMKPNERLAHRLYTEIQANTITDIPRFNTRKRELAEGLGIAHLPPNPDLLPLMPGALRKEQRALFAIKPVRNISGVAVLAAMVKPHLCPHGTCIYCPKGLHHPAPPAYTGDEPAAQRGYRNDFDPYRQVNGRIQQLQAVGRDTDKCELIIMGGTFLSMPLDYQYSFMQGCLEGLAGKRFPSMGETIAACETSANRVIGITMETRPDVAKKEDIARMLSWGSTRVELGVQTIYDDVLEKLNRQHTVKQTIDATRRLKESSLKVGYHMMAKLPHSELKRDMAAHLNIFSNPDFKPDMVKLYPVAVVANTALYGMWKRGEYEEMTQEEAVAFYAALKPRIPEWVRVMRVQRDIPTPNISAGVKKTNLRQLVEKRMKEEGTRCRCIRCREMGFKKVKEGVSPQKIELVTRSYEASGGMEYFISAEDVEQDILVGFIRLRIPHLPLFSELADSGFVREVHVYGQSVPLGEQNVTSGQHKGWGQRLLQEAERVTKEKHGLSHVNVIAGIGVREYYKNLGYVQNGAWVRKNLKG